MANNSDSQIVLGVKIQAQIIDTGDIGKAFDKIINGIEEQFDRVSDITWEGFKDYSRATSQDVSKTWGKTTKDMKGIAAESLWGTVSAWFEGDMDQVEDIWDNAWDSMIGSADKAWDGFLNKAAGRWLWLRQNSKGPKVFPGAFCFS